MKNNKGQALVEFIIILPVTLMLIFCVIDFGRVISLKNELENITTDVITMYENGDIKEEITSKINSKRKDKISIEINFDGDYHTITCKCTINPITPGLTYISKDVFDVESSRVIRNE